MTIKIGNINVGNKLPMLLIAGPCVIESAGLAHDVAGSIAEGRQSESADCRARQWLPHAPPPDARRTPAAS